MAASPRRKSTFAIDDALTVDQNIAALALKLRTADAQLMSILTPSLTNFSNEVSVDQDALLDALYAATASMLKPEVGDDVMEKDAGQ